jgi:hypothetical protein
MSNEIEKFFLGVILMSAFWGGVHSYLKCTWDLFESSNNFIMKTFCVSILLLVAVSVLFFICFLLDKG